MNRFTPIATRIAAAIIVSFCALACETKTIPEDDPSLGGGGAMSSAGRAGAASAGRAGAPTEGGDAGEAGDAPVAGSGGTPSAGSGNGGSAPQAGSAGMAVGGAPAACGNGTVDTGEECDDKNTKDGDGCSATCTDKCEKCEAAYCKNSDLKTSFGGCFGNDPLGMRLATGGPAAGTALTDLCQALVKCARRTGCAQLNLEDPVSSCFCGTQNSVECTANAQGPCANEVAAAAESRTFNDVQQRTGKTNFAVGMASEVLAGCDASACGRECLQGKNATSCEKCVLGSDPTVSNLLCGDYRGCYFLAEPAACTPGSSAEYCAAPLCAPAADCALTSGCAAKGIETCYGDGTGPCADQFAAATQSTDPATIKARLAANQPFPSAVLFRFLTCQVENCKSACYPASGG
jgi:cysteine-rich repeat protein